MFIISYDDYLNYVYGKNWENACLINSSYSNTTPWWIRNGIYEKVYEDEGYKDVVYGCLVNTDCPLKNEMLYPDKMSGIRPAIKIGLK